MPAADAQPSEALLRVRGLEVEFRSRGASTLAAGGVDLELEAGEILALVGESGSGKTVTALALTRLLPPAARVRGEVWYGGRELLAAPEPELRRVRGGEIAYVFQEPAGSLNPVYTIGAQIAESVALHRPGVRDRRGAALAALRAVGMRDPERCARSHPHELSGGMNQRAMIAMALAGRPRVLVADEPTTALDTTIQAEIMALLQGLGARLGMAMVLITHNFGIVKGFAHRVAVMRAGRIVEAGDTDAVLGDPREAYTRALIQCVPRLGERRRRLPTVAELAG